MLLEKTAFWHHDLFTLTAPSVLPTVRPASSWKQHTEATLQTTKYSYFRLMPDFPHTEDSSNTDTLTHSNHNSESADSQTYRQTSLSANINSTSQRTLGEFSIHLGHFPFVPSTVCLSARLSLPCVCSHALLLQKPRWLWGRRRDLMTNLRFCCSAKLKSDFADVCDVFILSRCLFFNVLRYITCCHRASFRKFILSI